MGQTTIPVPVTAQGNLKEVEFTASNATYTIPTGVTGFWALVIGSGGGGGASSTGSLSNAGGGGGGGQVLEKYFTVSGDTTLNITVGAAGTGGTAGGKGGTGNTSSIVGNTSSTTYATAAGGGGGGGGAVANVSANSGASGGGNGDNASIGGAGAGGGFTSAANDRTAGPFDKIPTSMGNGGTPTTKGVTGYSGGGVGEPGSGLGINIWGRKVAGGGNVRNGEANNFGAPAGSALNTVGAAATANTGAGGGGACTNTTTAYAGGAGGSGLVVLRYIG
jgi:hypothetical protein